MFYPGRRQTSLARPTFGEPFVGENRRSTCLVPFSKWERGTRPWLNSQMIAGKGYGRRVDNLGFPECLLGITHMEPQYWKRATAPGTQLDKFDMLLIDNLGLFLMRLDGTARRLFVRTGLNEYELAVKLVQLAVKLVQLKHLHVQGRPEKQTE